MNIDIVKRKLHPWTSQYGEVRYYLNDWNDLISDVLESYAANEWMSTDPLRKRMTPGMPSRYLYISNGCYRDL